MRWVSNRMVAGPPNPSCVYCALGGRHLRLIPICRAEWGPHIIVRFRALLPSWYDAGGRRLQKFQS